MNQVARNTPTPRVQQVAQQIRELTPQEIGQLIQLVPALRRPVKKEQLDYKISDQNLHNYVLKEMAALGDEYRPMQENDPFIGGLSVKGYFALPDEEQERLWAEQHTMDIDDFEERDVQPDAQVSAR